MSDRKKKKDGFGNEVPKLSDILLVLLVAALMVSLCYIGWYKYGWFH